MDNTLHEVKIPVSDLEKGMYVSRLDKDWSDSPFAFQGFLINNQKLIKQLQKECTDVYIDAVKGDVPQKTQEIAAPSTNKSEKKGFFDKLWGKKEGATAINFEREHTHQLADIIEHKISAKTITPPKALLTFDKEMGAAKQTHAKTSIAVKSTMTLVKEGKDVDIGIAKDSVHECMESVLRSPDAMMLMTNLKTKHKNTWQQCMNAAVLTITFGRYLNLSDKELVTLGLCGMLFDIGKMRISKEDLEHAVNKQDLIQSHTTLGYEVLSHCPGALGKTVAEVARDHHEQLDGSGYPQGLKGKEISAYTRMISIVDTYNMLTSDKPNKKA